MSSIISQVANWFLSLVTSVLSFLIDVFEYILTAVLNLLPAMPQLTQPVLQFTGWLNYMLPMSELSAIFATAGIVFAGLYIYKLVKLIRGAG
jgi:hypothetical protein